MKIFAFTFAGGNLFAYDSIKKCLPPDFSMDIIEYPGRGGRAKEPLIDDLEIVADNVFNKLLNKIGEDEDYMLYGHSMGALVAYLVALKIIGSNLKTPLKVVVSGSRPPSALNQKTSYNLPSNLFWERIYSLGGIPKEYLQEQEYLSFIEPILRSDIKAVELFINENDQKLSMPVEVHYGSLEYERSEDLNAWKEVTTAPVKFRKFVGNHFFIYDHGRAVAMALI